MRRAVPRHALTSDRPHRSRPVIAAIGSLLIGAAGLIVPAAAAPNAGAVTVRSAAGTVAAAGRLAQVAGWAQWGVDNRIPYRYGGGHGATPSIAGGADCSGFVRWAYYKGFGVDIGSGSADSMIRTSGKFVKVSHPVPGDVVLLGRGGSAPAYHTSIYIGIRNGHPASAAESTTGQPAKIQYWYTGTSAQNFMGYWRYRGATADLPVARTASTVSAALSAGAISSRKVSLIRFVVRAADRVPIRGAVVSLYQRAPGGAFRLVARTTAATGASSFRLVGNDIGHDYLLRYRGDSRHLADDSTIVTQYSRAGVKSATSTIGPLHYGSVVGIKGITSGHRHGDRVVLQKLTPRGWVTTGRAGTVAKHGKFAVVWRAIAGGTFRFAMPKDARSRQAATVSRVYRIVVR